MGFITVDLRPGDRLRVGQTVVVFEHKSGRSARLHVQAPKEVEVRREARDSDSPPRANHETMRTEG